MSLDVLLNTYGHHHPDYLSDAIDKITRRETKIERSEIVSGAVRKSRVREAGKQLILMVGPAGLEPATRPL